MTLPMKPGEPYQQFLARLDASYQKLREQDVELNATVRDGPWLHASEEATVGVEGGVHDTATKGSMSYERRLWKLPGPSSQRGKAQLIEPRRSFKQRSVIRQVDLQLTLTNRCLGGDGSYRS